VVIQVSSADPKTHALALSNAVNIQKHYGIDNIAVEIVAYGPGLSMLTKQSSVTERVSSLMIEEITFTACGNTMDTIAHNTGKQPELIKGVGKVQTGLARIIELQEQGYSYVKP
jgi:intracellular sulfur oxidation DsrE/DsrF family protein